MECIECTQIYHHVCVESQSVKWFTKRKHWNQLNFTPIESAQLFHILRISATFMHHRYVDGIHDILQFCMCHHALWSKYTPHLSSYHYNREAHHIHLKWGKKALTCALQHKIRRGPFPIQEVDFLRQEMPATANYQLPWAKRCLQHYF